MLDEQITDARAWLGADIDSSECVVEPSGFLDGSPGDWYGGPYWGTWSDDWSAFTGNDWFSICWQLANRDPAQPGTHSAGIFLNRQKLGIPSGDALASPFILAIARSSCSAPSEKALAAS